MRKSLEEEEEQEERLGFENTHGSVAVMVGESDIAILDFIEGWLSFALSRFGHPNPEAAQP